MKKRWGIMGEKYTVFLKNLGLFFIAGFLPNTLAFFMIPLYTRCLTDAEYGAVDLLLNTVQLLMPVLTVQVQDAVLRFTMDDAWESRDVLRNGVRIAMAGFGILCICCTGLLALSFFEIPFLGIRTLDRPYLLFFIFTYLAGTLLNIFSSFCRGMNRVRALTEGSLLNMALLVCFNLLFLWKWDWGLYGYLAANLIGTGADALYIYVRAGLGRYLFQKGKIPGALVKEMACFSVPLIFSALSWWINNASDKYILTYFYGVFVVGVYAVAYKIPTILKVFGDIASMAFSISAIREFDTNDPDGFIGNSYSMISFFMSLSCSALMLCNQAIAGILFAKGFFKAWHFVPPLLFSVVMNQLSMSCENILVAAKQTKVVSASAVTGAAVNTAANFMLIPLFGAYGAAVATAAGFACFWALRYVYLKKTVRMQDNIWREGSSYLLLIVQCIAAYWGSRFWYIQAAVFISILLLYQKKLAWLSGCLRQRLRT